MIYELSFNQKPISSTIHLDGSKSISNRLLILRELSKQEFVINNLSNSNDSKLMQEFLAKYQGTNSFHVHNAGTVARFATAFLAIQPKSFTLTCDNAMKKRPISILVDALRHLAAEIEYLEKDGFLPIRINGNKNLNDTIKIDATVSSQYITALMLIAPTLPNGLTIQLKGNIASLPYLYITQQCMQTCGFEVDINEQIITIKNGQQKIPEEVFVESDWSAAAFFYSIVTLNKNLKFQLTHLLENSSQGDSIITNWFQQFGVSTFFDEENKSIEIKSETYNKNSSLTFDFYNHPDLLPAIAVICAGLGIYATFSGVQNLVIKESNRLVAMQNELAKVGASMKEINSSTWEISGKIDKQKLKETVFETYEDHRIAMSLACLAFKYDGVKIKNPEVVSKSYPAFWVDMQKIGIKINASFHSTA